MHPSAAVPHFLFVLFPNSMSDVHGGSPHPHDTTHTIFMFYIYIYTSQIHYSLTTHSGLTNTRSLVLLGVQFCASLDQPTFFFLVWKKKRKKEEKKTLSIMTESRKSDRLDSGDGDWSLESRIRSFYVRTDHLQQLSIFPKINVMKQIEKVDQVNVRLTMSLILYF